MDSDLELALRLADTADAITLARFRAVDLRVTRKPDRTPVTDADTAVEDALRRLIDEERPGDAVLGEERGGTVPETGRGWVLDPIDGTSLARAANTDKDIIKVANNLAIVLEHLDGVSGHPAGTGAAH